MKVKIIHANLKLSIHFVRKLAILLLGNSFYSKSALEKCVENDVSRYTRVRSHNNNNNNLNPDFHLDLFFIIYSRIRNVNILD